MFSRRLADTLREATLDLGDCEKRVDQNAVVIDRRIAIEGNGVGSRIDPGLCRTAAVGDGKPIPG